VGDFFADLVVEGRVIIELKAIQSLAKEHEVQLVNYLTATGLDDGLLINFGPSVEVKRKFREYKRQD
jgi:GxxExxY protein